MAGWNSARRRDGQTHDLPPVSDRRQPEESVRFISPPDLAKFTALHGTLHFAERDGHTPRGRDSESETRRTYGRSIRFSLNSCKNAPPAGPDNLGPIITTRAESRGNRCARGNISEDPRPPGSASSLVQRPICLALGGRFSGIQRGRRNGHRTHRA